MNESFWDCRNAEQEDKKSGNSKAAAGAFMVSILLVITVFLNFSSVVSFKEFVDEGKNHAQWREVSAKKPAINATVSFTITEDGWRVISFRHYEGGGLSPWTEIYRVRDEKIQCYDGRGEGLEEDNSWLTVKSAPPWILSGVKKGEKKLGYSS